MYLYLDRLLLVLFVRVDGWSVGLYFFPLLVRAVDD